MCSPKLKVQHPKCDKKRIFPTLVAVTLLVSFSLAIIALLARLPRKEKR